MPCSNLTPTIPISPHSGLRLCTADTPELLAQILVLQRNNSRAHLSPQVQARDGFVFVEHTPEQLARLAAVWPQVVALDGDRVVGYNLCMGPTMRDEIPCLRSMFEQFDCLSFRGRLLAEWRYVVGGQVCVDAAYRGRGLIGALYRATKAFLPSTVELCVTEIAMRNERSRRAHYRIGFEPVGHYRDAAEDWEVVAWPW